MKFWVQYINSSCGYRLLFVMYLYLVITYVKQMHDTHNMGV